MDDQLPWGLAMNHHLPLHGALLCSWVWDNIPNTGGFIIFMALTMNLVLCHAQLVWSVPRSEKP
jgi:hypothetical protein